VPSPQVPFLNMMFKAITLEMALVYILSPEQRSKAVADVTRLLQDGALVPRIAPVFAMADAAKAHEAVEQNARDGAVLVRMS